MIVRILGEGQLHVADEHLAELNLLDDELTEAVEAGDDARFADRLEALLTRVRALGSPVPTGHLAQSDVVLPGSWSTLAEVRSLLGEEGLIPG